MTFEILPEVKVLFGLVCFMSGNRVVPLGRKSGEGETVKDRVQQMEQNGSRCMDGTAKAEGLNVWIFPAPYVTHINCFFHFALQLVRQGLTVTFFSNDEEIRRLHASEMGKLEIEKCKRDGLNLKFHSLYTVSGSVDRVEISSFVLKTHKRVRLAISTTEEFLVKFMRSECESGRKPTCLISDVWFSIAREVATECGVPAWLMSPYSSGYLSLITYIFELEAKGILKMPYSPQEEESRDELISVPGLPFLRIREIPSFYFRSHPMSDSAVRNAKSVAKCDVVLLSSYYELESRSFREFERMMKALAIKNGREIPQIWNVGPTFDFLSYSNGSNLEGSGDETKHPGIGFLDSQVASSVVLLIFGTLVSLSEEQVVEIARGLENSHQPFLCVLNAPVMVSGVETDDIFSVIPSDCVERSRGRGLFVQGWVPQLKLLAHSATGAFVSHCGHNSMLESLSMGVPILAWPDTSDQFLNCRFLVDEAEVALEVNKGSGGIVDRHEVERSVKDLFHSGKGMNVRKKAKEMRESAIRTVGEKGTTRKNIQSLIGLIRAKAGE